MINRAIIIGHLTKDVEVKKTPSDLSVASFTVAVNRIKKDDPADFINCVAWRGTADFLGRYAKKGSLVGVEGRIQTRNWDDKTTGKKVYVTEIVCDNVQLLNNAGKPSEQKPNEDYRTDDDPRDTQEMDLTSDDLPF